MLILDTRVLKAGAEERMKEHDNMHLEDRLESYSDNGGFAIQDTSWNRPHPQARQRYTLTPAQLRRMGFGR